MSREKIRTIFKGMDKTDKIVDARIELQCPPSLKAKAQQGARLEGISTNAWIRQAMERAWDSIPKGMKESA